MSFESIYYRIRLHDDEPDGDDEGDDDGDNDLSGILRRLATSRAALGGSLVLDFHR